jgi:hypothetical protein
MFEKEIRQQMEETSSIQATLKFVPYDIAQGFQLSATVNIILESRSEISPFLPAKFPLCVFADKPILSLSPYYSEVRRLLGKSYPYCVEANDVDGIANAMTALYDKWKAGEKLTLDRADLLEYLSSGYLKQRIESLLN